MKDAHKTDKYYKSMLNDEVVVNVETKERPKEDKDKASTVLELLLCPPKFLSTKVRNNRWMQKMDGKELEVNVDKAMAQWHDMYSLFTQEATVYLLPPDKRYQDQVYVTNAGVVLPHVGKLVILSKYKAEGRPGEEIELKDFCEVLDYEAVQCPHFFEGEAELKWVKDNIYIGGYGIRTDIEALNWIEKKYDAKIIKVKETDPLTYHLDCSIFPITNDKVICNNDLVKGETLKEVEKICEPIMVTKKEAEFSLTNCLRIGSVIYNVTSIKTMKEDDEEYPFEKQKNEKLEKICRDIGLEMVWVNLSEFNKSGAALSCCVMHLTYPKLFDADK
jgi:N-dimethylarginine dimethylaminohydrolase